MTTIFVIYRPSRFMWKAYCHVKILKAKKEKLKKSDLNLKTLISNSKWDKATRPGVVVDMSGNRLSKFERQLLSLGIKFATGLWMLL